MKADEENGVLGAADFKEFPLEFSPMEHAAKEWCWCSRCKNRNNGRFILRGLLQLNDYVLTKDVWEK